MGLVAAIENARRIPAMTRKLTRALMLVLLAAPMFASAAQKTFVMVPKGVHPYYEPCYEGFQAAAKKYGVKVEKVDPQKFELPLQVKVIEDLIAQKVDGIAISALDDAGLVPVIADATKAGIKVITFDADAKSSARLEYIGTNNEAAGMAAGKKVAELMKGQGNIVILQGGLGASNLNERTAGFKKAIAGTKIKLLEVTDVAGDFSVATNKTEALLQTYPELNAIFAVSAEGAPAAAQVLKEQKKAGKILLAGFDDLKDTLEGIRDGSVAFCLVQKTFKMGWLSVEALLDAGKGKKLPPVTDTGVLFVTKENVGSYMDEMKKEYAAK
jgi:ribose transport system substrate-binding protein